MRVPLSRWTFFVEDTMKEPWDALVAWELSAIPFRPNTPELVELSTPEAETPGAPATAEELELMVEPRVVPVALPAEAAVFVAAPAVLPTVDVAPPSRPPPEPDGLLAPAAGIATAPEVAP